MRTADHRRMEPVEPLPYDAPCARIRRSYERASSASTASTGCRTWAGPEPVAPQVEVPPFERPTRDLDACDRTPLERLVQRSNWLDCTANRTHHRATSSLRALLRAPCEVP
jgi:hypothetical protein